MSSVASGAFVDYECCMLARARARGNLNNKASQRHVLRDNLGNLVFKLASKSHEQQSSLGTTNSITGVPSLVPKIIFYMQNIYFYTQVRVDY